MLTRKNDPKLPWIMLITFVVVAAVVELVGILLGSPYLFSCSPSCSACWPR